MDALRQNPFVEAPAESWLGELSFDVGPRAGCSRLTHLSHIGPLRIQRPFHPESDGTAHVYLLHPPGGVAGGDHLRISAHVQAGASALLTMPAATKIYRTLGATSVIENRLMVESEATLEWLPQETILFDGSVSETRSIVELEKGANYLGWEISCLGRPAAGENFVSGRFCQTLEIYREGRPLLIDRLVVPAKSAIRTATWGLGGARVVGSFVVVTSDPRALPATRGALGRASEAWARQSGELGRPLWESKPGRLAATQLQGVLSVRYLGFSVVECHQALSDVWQELRPLLLGKKAVPPRVWRV